jgi:hypothetical protein
MTINTMLQVVSLTRIGKPLILPNAYVTKPKIVLWDLDPTTKCIIASSLTTAIANIDKHGCSNVYKSLHYAVIGFHQQVKNFAFVIFVDVNPTRGLLGCCIC